MEKTEGCIFGFVTSEAFRFAKENNVALAKNDYRKYEKVFEVIRTFLSEDLDRYKEEYETVDYYDYNFTFSDHFKVLEMIEAEEIADMDDRFVADVNDLVDAILWKMQIKEQKNWFNN